MGSSEYVLTAVSIMYVQRYMQIEYTKTLNDVLNQNTTTSKRARFAIFAISVVDNLLLFNSERAPPPPASLGHLSFSFGKAANALRWGRRIIQKLYCGALR